MLKADLHIHTTEDPVNHWKVKHDVFQLIDYAASKGFKVLAITLHNKLFYNEKIKDYAKNKDIILIPGIEVRIGLQDFLVLMKKPIRNVENIKSYDDLRSFKKKNSKDIIIIAAHLFYPRYVFFPINPKYDVADSFEYSHFYTTWLNLNRRAVKIARSLGKPVIGNSDAHALWQMNHTYSIIDSKKDVDSVFSAIKKGDVSVITEPFFFRTLIFMLNPINIIKDLFCKTKR